MCQGLLLLNEFFLSYGFSVLVGIDVVKVMVAYQSQWEGPF